MNKPNTLKLARWSDPSPRELLPEVSCAVSGSLRGRDFGPGPQNCHSLPRRPSPSFQCCSLQGEYRNSWPSSDSGIKPTNQRGCAAIRAFCKGQDGPGARTLELHGYRLQNYVQGFLIAIEDLNEPHVWIISVIKPRKVVRTGRKYMSRNPLPVVETSSS